MRRREFIGLVGTAALSFPRTGYSETSASLPLVGVLSPAKQDSELARQIIPAVRNGLQEEGLTEGKHYTLAIRLADGNFARLLPLAMASRAEGDSPITPRYAETSWPTERCAAILQRHHVPA